MTFLDPITWFSSREVSFKPPHFVTTSTNVTEESKFWILNTLRGRFVLIEASGYLTRNKKFVPAFEDPKEAILYELAWS
jgi:hypothetical protein